MKILMIVIITLIVLNLLSYLEFIRYFKKNKDNKKGLSIRIDISMILTGFIAVLSVILIFLKVIS